MNGMPVIQLPCSISPLPCRSFWRPAKFPLCGHVHHHHLSALVIGNVFALNVYPGLIFPGVLTAVHTREKHILRVFVFDTSGDFNIAVLFIGSGFFLADKFGSVV